MKKDDVVKNLSATIREQELTITLQQAEILRLKSRISAKRRSDQPALKTMKQSARITKGVAQVAKSMHRAMAKKASKHA